MTASAIVPARNEADRIAATVGALRSLPAVGEVVVVDDGSRDDTASRAGAAGATVVRLPGGHGKAAALRAGVSASRGDPVLLVDADLGATAAAVETLLDAVASGRCDLAVGRLPRRVARGGWGLVVGLARHAVETAGGPHLQAPLSGQRACRRSLLATMPTWGVGYGVEIAMTLHALRSGARIEEFDIDATHRITGMDPAGIFHRARQFRDVALTLLLWRLRR